MAEKFVPNDLKRVDSGVSQLLHTIDPFATKKMFWESFIDGLLATALFRCYHIIVFFTAWATCVTLINHQDVYPLNFQSTLLTVVGTIIGFVISYRTTSSFERYNEGRRLWSQIILHSRNCARTVWFHVPDISAATPDAKNRSDEELKARTIVEKKTVVNLIEAFGVAVKHYLRGEVGTYYEDLWHLVKFLPAYALPPGLPTVIPEMEQELQEHEAVAVTTATEQTPSTTPAQLPLPNVANVKKKPSNITIATPPLPNGRERRTSLVPPGSAASRSSFGNVARPSFASGHSARPLSHGPSYNGEEPRLFPARNPPKLSYLDVFPFSLLVSRLTSRGKELQGRKAARLRATKLGRGKRGTIISQNVPLEITLYLSSYIAALQRRKVIDVPTINALFTALNGLVDALTGLERILTTPIPFSYRIHLWLVTTIYCIALPLQIWKTLGWITIPATSILSFIFFGFLVAGEEIENPFGYDKNDLNMDHFTQSIIRPELIAITSLPTPEPAEWAFSPMNDYIFDSHSLPGDMAASRIIERATPDEWVSRGTVHMTEVLSKKLDRTTLSY
ncbi:hypothetical protein M422DRAFT_28203 [Sphaerobolus stellatus SS14]|nr:hypothetical protein M422DRAFT_28203 [Sphaerobolus stellatus SS14]